MKPPQATMGPIHRSAALHRVAEPVAVPAGEEPAAAIELCNLPAAIHAIRANVANEPGPFSAKRQGVQRIGTRWVTGCQSSPDDLIR